MVQENSFKVGVFVVGGGGYGDSGCCGGARFTFFAKKPCNNKIVNLCFVFSGYFRYKTVDLDHDHARLFVRV